MLQEKKIMIVKIRSKCYCDLVIHSLTDKMSNVCDALFGSLITYYSRVYYVRNIIMYYTWWIVKIPYNKVIKTIRIHFFKGFTFNFLINYNILSFELLKFVFQFLWALSNSKIIIIIIIYIYHYYYFILIRVTSARKKENEITVDIYFPSERIMFLVSIYNIYTILLLYACYIVSWWRRRLVYK